MPWNGAQHAIKCGDGVSRPILWVSISKVSCLETLNIAKKLFIKISAIQRFLFVVFAGRKQPKHIEKCQKFEKSQVRSDNEILWKISAKFTNSEVSVLNFKSRVSEFLLQVSSLGRLDSDFLSPDPILFSKFWIQIRSGSGTNETHSIQLLFDSSLLYVKQTTSDVFSAKTQSNVAVADKNSLLIQFEVAGGRIQKCRIQSTHTSGLQITVRQQVNSGLQTPICWEPFVGGKLLRRPEPTKERGEQKIFRIIPIEIRYRVSQNKWNP